MTISWELDDGSLRIVTATALNWSQNGLRVSSPDRLEARTFVQVQSRQRGSLGAACVRYCERYGMRYIAGLEFTGGMTLRNPPPGSESQAS